MKYFISLLSILLLVACGSSDIEPALTFKTLDTDFSKGRLTHIQTHTLADLEQFHGHLCDGLVLGALAIQEAMKVLQPEGGPIDRTNFRIQSKPSPCLTDAAVYMTGGRYQFNTFFVDTAFEGLYILQRVDNSQAVRVSLNVGVKPPVIDSLGAIAVRRQLSPCAIDSLRSIEDKFTETLLTAQTEDLFTVSILTDFVWEPKLRYDFSKIDILNKTLPPCE